jgi:hypothetical protein
MEHVVDEYRKPKAIRRSLRIRDRSEYDENQTTHDTNLPLAATTSTTLGLEYVTTCETTSVVTYRSSCILRSFFANL